MRFLVENGWTCSHAQASAWSLRAPGTMSFARGLSGSHAHRWSFSEDDFEWPDASHQLDMQDICDCLGLAKSACFFDVNEGCRLVADSVLKWDTMYVIMQRACPRCTMCGKTCGRTGPHKLCSHGGTEHVWHFLGRSHNRIYISVQGYWRPQSGGLPSDLGDLTTDTFNTELAAIRDWIAIL